MSYPSPSAGNELSMLRSSRILRIGALRRAARELELDAGALYLDAREISTQNRADRRERVRSLERRARERQDMAAEVTAVADYLEAADQ